jgi:hypothetical protein
VQVYVQNHSMLLKTNSNPASPAYLSMLADQNPELLKTLTLAART